MTSPSSSIDTQIELYDEDVKAITEGPVAWHETRMNVRRDIDDHAKALEEQFHKIGLLVEVQVWLHTPDASNNAFDGPVFFKVMVTGRVRPESGYDYDKQRHQVQNNLLQIPGEGGTIKFDEREFLRQHGGGHRH